MENGRWTSSDEAPIKPTQTQRSITRELLEVRMGFEPTYNGFANRCLATWLPHRNRPQRAFYKAEEGEGGGSRLSADAGRKMPRASGGVKAFDGRRIFFAGRRGQGPLPMPGGWYWPSLSAST